MRLLAALVVLSASLCVHAADDPLVAHEWGTFTSVQGADGVQLKWTPTLKTDLPDFVYSSSVRNGGLVGIQLLGAGGKDLLSGRVRMETPVIYFYSQAERQVDVTVLFPDGRITEWYPQATNVGPFVATTQIGQQQAQRSLIEWRDVKILPRETQEITAAALLRDREDPEARHYYAARNTDANFLRIASPRAGVEHERDLFYRGIGFFAAPLTVKVDGGERALSLTTAEPIVDAFVLTIRDGLMRYQRIDRVSPSSAVRVELDLPPFGAFDLQRESIMREMCQALVSHGLYEKEAQAMVETWRDQWFAEEGTRVLYLLPRSWTDRVLPLEISPRPDSIVRVMVGRSELIVPSAERELEKHILTYVTGDDAGKRQAVAAVRQMKLGRFLTAAMQIVLDKRPDAAFWAVAWELPAHVNQPEHAIAQVKQ